MRYSCCALIVAVTLLSGSTHAHAQVSLRYKFKEGDVLVYALNQNMKMTAEFGGMKNQTTADISTEMTLKVESVDAKGNGRIKVTFGKVRMSMESPMGKIEVDSSKEPDDPLAKTLYPMLATITSVDMSFTLDARGQMSDAKMAPEVAEKLKKLGGVAPAFTEDQLKKMATQGLVFPSDPVDKGKSWRQQDKISAPFGKLSMDSEYTFAGMEEKNGRMLAKIAIKPTLKMEADPNSKIAVDLKSADVKGTLYFDNQAGRIAELTENQNLVMEVAGASVRQDSVSTMKLKAK